MKKFISGGIAFVMLDEGEGYPPTTIDLIEARLIYHYEGRWWIKIASGGKWKNYTADNFETQNEAFNRAYEDYRKRGY